MLCSMGHCGDGGAGDGLVFCVVCGLCFVGFTVEAFNTLCVSVVYGKEGDMDVGDTMRMRCEAGRRTRIVCFTKQRTSLLTSKQ